MCRRLEEKVGTRIEDQMGEENMELSFSLLINFPFFPLVVPPLAAEQKLAGE